MLVMPDGGRRIDHAGQYAPILVDATVHEKNGAAILFGTVEPLAWSVMPHWERHKHAETLAAALRKRSVASALVRADSRVVIEVRADGKLLVR
jgi:hypothetical protein